MKRYLLFAAFAALVAAMALAQAARHDWAQLSRFAQANTELLALAGGKVKVVFMGNSITEGWVEIHPEFFTANGFVGRGISGQTSGQMLVRFRQDVVGLHPKAVVILAGTNDVAENSGPYSQEHTLGNIASMCEVAKANGIKVVLCTVPPVASFPWNRDVADVAGKIKRLNAAIAAYAKRNKLQLVDYYSAMVAGADSAMNSSLTTDGVHPVLNGYLVMEPLVLKAIKKAGVKL